MKKVLLSLVVLFSLTSCNSNKEVEKKSCKSEYTIVKNEVTDTLIDFSVRNTLDSCYSIDYEFVWPVVNGVVGGIAGQNDADFAYIPITITVNDLNNGSFKVYANQQDPYKNVWGNVEYSKFKGTFTIYPKVAFTFNQIRFQDIARITVNYDATNKTLALADTVK